MELKDWVNHFRSIYKGSVDKYINGDNSIFFNTDPLNPIDIQMKKKLIEILKYPYTEKEKESNKQALILVKNLLPQKLAADEWESVKKEFNAIPNNISKFYEKHCEDTEVILKSSIKEMSGVSDQTLEKIYQLAVELNADGDFEDAKKVFYFLRMFAVYCVNIWIGEIVCMKNLRDFHEAIDLSSFAITIFPESTSLHLHLADCLIQTGSPFQASREIDEAKRLSKNEGSNDIFESTFTYLESQLPKEGEV